MQTPVKDTINAGPPPVGPYSPAVKAAGLVYVSGTLAQDKDGAISGKGDIGAQTRRVIERIREILSASGTSLDQAVAVTVYLRSASDFAAMNEVYKTFWAANPPTRTTVVADLVLPDALVEMSMIAAMPGAERAVIHPAGWMKSPNPYSYGIKTGDTLFLSGLISRNGRDNTAVAGDVTAQTRTVMDNARELLEAAGLSFDNVVSARVFLPDLSTFQQMNATYRPYFKSAPPARATVAAGLTSSQYNVEVTLIASSAPREAIETGTRNPNLSAAVRAGNRIYLAGVLGDTPETKGDPAAQTRETLARIRKTLEAAGCTPQDVVDALVYLPDLKHYAAMNDAYRAFFQKSFPARATVGTPLFAPDGLVEIMMTAVKP
jgi:aminoacrylate peracid reductase